MKAQTQKYLEESNIYIVKFNDGYLFAHVTRSDYTNHPGEAFSANPHQLFYSEDEAVTAAVKYCNRLPTPDNK